MSLLDQLWDDTVAGPRPDNGLGRLRKFRTFDLRSDSGKDSYGGNLMSEDAIRVTRSILIVKPPGCYNQSSSSPVSPAGSTPPGSPLSGSNKGSFRFRRRSTSDAHERSNESRRRSPPPPPHDVPSASKQSSMVL